MNKTERVTIRLRPELRDRLRAYAHEHDRSFSWVFCTMAERGLNDVECAAIIRQADSAEIDMRFCSPHCRHMDIHGHCHCSAVVDSVLSVINGVGTGMVELHIAGSKFHRHEKCPYSEADFRWWQQGAVEDARTVEELSE